MPLIDQIDHSAAVGRRKFQRAAAQIPVAIGGIFLRQLVQLHRIMAEVIFLAFEIQPVEGAHETLQPRAPVNVRGQPVAGQTENVAHPVIAQVEQFVLYDDFSHG